MFLQPKLVFVVARLELTRLMVRLEEFALPEEEVVAR